MAVNRVTQRMLIDRVLNNVSANERRLLLLQTQLSTGLRVNRPSDDPLAARRAVSLKTLIAQNDQFLTNISSAMPQLVETDQALSSLLDLVQRAYELTLQGATGTNAQLQRDQIAVEINQIFEQVLVEANHTTNGRYIFGGTNTLNAPYTGVRNPTGELINVLHNGNVEPIEIEISRGVRVQINISGHKVFPQISPTTVGIFGLLMNTQTTCAMEI